MNDDAHEWLMPTPHGVLRAFGSPEPDAMAQTLQSLLTRDRALTMQEWQGSAPEAAALRAVAVQHGWLEVLRRPLQGPDARLDDFLQHVIASLSGERVAVLASDGGFCVGRSGLPQEQAETLAAAAADFGSYAQRQARRGWSGAMRGVAFHDDPDLLLPSTSFVPLWVDGSGYWLILGGEPLLNNPALVELLWGIKLAGTRFAVTA